MSEKKQVMFIPRQSISPKDKEKLTKNGYIVIECDNPEKIKTVQDIETTSPNIMLKAALKAIGRGTSITNARDIFTETLANLLNQQ